MSIKAMASISLADQLFNAEFLKAQTLLINKRQSFKLITTRTLYPGRHHAELVINGVPCAKKSFDLLA